MISVIIPTLNDEARLPRALAPLIAGLAAGVLRQAIVADAGSTDGTLETAEAAGCDVVRVTSGDYRPALAAARGDWLMFLSPRVVLTSDWLAETDNFLKRPDAADCVACFKLDDKNSAFASAMENARANLTGQPSLVQGALIARRRYAGSVADGAPRAKGLRLVILKVRAMRA